MDHLVEELSRAVKDWDRRGWPRPDALVVSGSGLAVDLPGATEHRARLGELVPYDVHPVVGHPHRVELLSVGDRHVIYQRGRVHSYQGYNGAETVFMVRLAALLGARTLIMTNAAGGLAADARPGNLLTIRDHLNLTGLTPLRGEPPAEWGPRFPDMVGAYDPALRELASAVAEELGIELGSGVYAGLAGPAYETPAEVDMSRTLGADLVGMSTVLEVIAARHIGLRCLCFSLISNLAAGTASGPLGYEEVLEAGREAGDRVGRLIGRLLERPELYAVET
ncbi:MAG: purine-nucleoside phosphorylase [Acidobacteriota bacterium]|nr:purine-nucleoside phosphorylase [Acidobacteriota bacterium]